MDLRSHVALSSELGLAEARAVSALHADCEAEVSNLQSEVRVEEHILWLEVSVGNALVVHVLQSVHELVEVGTSNSLLKPASLGNVVEQLSALS